MINSPLVMGVRKFYLGTTCHAPEIELLDSLALITRRGEGGKYYEKRMIVSSVPTQTQSG
jgi:hypothetical protein